MSEGNSEMNHVNQAPEAQVHTKRGFSIVWVVPVIALLIGSWLALKAWSEKGPVITIAFENAEGLEANKTKIKFKDVEVGVVTNISLDDDLAGVIITAEMNKEAGKYIREKTQFWVVRAQVAAGEVSGLSTLFSGAYIGCNPSTEGKEVTQFEGLEKPPVITSGLPGHNFVLEADTIGSLDIGSPVYHRGIKVGQVVDYDFDESAESINLRVFVNAPYHKKVLQNSRFWNVSGVEFELDTEGITIKTQSLVSIMLGGVAFDLPKNLEPSGSAEEGQEFQLYNRREDIEERSYSVSSKFVLYFDQNVRGLEPGAPVEIRGIKIGEVLDIKLEVDNEDVTVRVAVLVAIEPERIDTQIVDNVPTRVDRRVVLDEESDDNLARLIDKGLRAQLKTGNLLTGQLYVDFDFYPDMDPVKITHHNGYKVFPTVLAPLEQIAQRVNNILIKAENIPFEEIGLEMKKAIKTLNGTLEAAKKVAGGVNNEILPELKEALKGFQVTMDGIEQTLGPDSALNYNTRNVMSEMATTVRSLRALIDYVERNPQSVIFGKETE